MLKIFTRISTVAFGIMALLIWILPFIAAKVNNFRAVRFSNQFEDVVDFLPESSEILAKHTYIGNGGNGNWCIVSSEIELSTSLSLDEMDEYYLGLISSNQLTLKNVLLSDGNTALFTYDSPLDEFMQGSGFHKFVRHKSREDGQYNNTLIIAIMSGIDAGFDYRCR